MGKDGYYGDFESMADEQAAYDKEEQKRAELEYQEEQYKEAYKMNTIEFSHRYTKLPAGIKTAVLVAVEPVRLQEQTEGFIKYDCRHETKSFGIVLDKKIYGLWGNIDNTINNPDLLLLCLISDTGAFFTTLRKDNAENREKYMTLVDRGDKVGLCQEPRYGRYFQIIIKEG